MIKTCEYFRFIRQRFKIYVENKRRKRTELVCMAVFKKVGRVDGSNQAKAFIFLSKNGIQYKRGTDFITL
jgi:hypothetical protein